MSMRTVIAGRQTGHPTSSSATRKALLSQKPVSQNYVSPVKYPPGGDIVLAGNNRPRYANLSLPMKISLPPRQILHSAYNEIAPV